MLSSCNQTGIVIVITAQYACFIPLSHNVDQDSTANSEASVECGYVTLFYSSTRERAPGSSTIGQTCSHCACTSDEIVWYGNLAHGSLSITYEWHLAQPVQRKGHSHRAEVLSR